MKRLLLIAAGIFFVVLGYFGTVIPGLPTTPFLILAAACFVKSSPKLHGWLLNNRIFGPMLAEWEKTRSISRKTKITAILMMLVMGVSSVILIKKLYVKIIILCFLLFGLVFMARIKESVTDDKRVIKQK